MNKSYEFICSMKDKGLKIVSEKWASDGIGIHEESSNSLMSLFGWTSLEIGREKYWIAPEYAADFREMVENLLP